MKYIFIAIFIIVNLNFNSKLFAQLYDLEIIFVKMKCLKVVEAPFDTEEDIYGRIGLWAYKFLDDSNKPKYFGCCIDSKGSGTVKEYLNNSKYSLIKLGLNESRTFNTSHIITNLTYKNLTTLDFKIGGSLYDDDLITVSYQNCNECGDQSSRFVRMSAYKPQIDALTTAGSKYLKTGNDDIMELNYY